MTLLKGMTATLALPDGGSLSLGLGQDDSRDHKASNQQGKDNDAEEWTLHGFVDYNPSHKSGIRRSAWFGVDSVDVA